MSEHPEETDKDTEAIVDIFGNLQQPKFPVHLFPSTVANYAKDQAELMGVDPAIICMGALGVMAGALDDRLQIQPKRHDPTWRESPRLWVAVIGDPSMKKTPGLNKAKAPLKLVEMKWRKRNEELMSQWESDCNQIKAEDKKATLPPAPQQKRLIVSDVTVESLGAILSNQPPRGILVDRDELTGWLASMDAYKNGAGKDRAAWLEAFNGGAMAVDRIGAGRSIYIENFSACVVGGIQPQIIHEYANVTNHDGMLQRFILVHAAQGAPGQDRRPDMDAKQRYSDLIEHLTNIEPGIDPVQLSEPAHLIREALDRVLDKAISSVPNQHMSSMLGKWPGLFARTLLIFHAVESASRSEHPTSRPVAEKTAQNVSDLFLKVFLPHAAKFYEGIDHEETDAKQLAGLILARGWERFTVKRDLHNNMLSYRKMKEWERQAMLDRLECYGWITPESGKLNSSGKPVAYIVNSHVHHRFKKQAEKEKERRAEVTTMMAELKTG